jgi:hypothetical protein
MSWSNFKSTMGTYMGNPNGVESKEDFAKQFTQAYDSAVKAGTINTRGFAGVNLPILEGKVDLMEQLMVAACSIALTKSERHTFLKDVGQAVIAYWTGATLTDIPPFEPATNSFQNIQSVFAIVNNPGQWSDTPAELPVDDVNIFLDNFILYATQHLSTIQFTIQTISLYPGFPLFPPSPGVVVTSGYFIPPAEPTPPQEKTVEELLEEIEDDNNTVEGARKIVQTYGTTEVLSDEGQDISPQIVEVKSKLASVVPPPPPLNDPQEVDGTNNIEGVAVQCGVEIDYEENFTSDVRLRTLCLDCTFPHKLKPQRGLSLEDIVCNLKAVAENLVQPIKQRYPNVQINSGFRGTPSIPGGVSQHEKGEAIDIQFTGVTPLGYLSITEWIINNLAFDQIIFEHGKSIWLHLSYKRTGTNRKKKLTMINGRYENGIKCYYNF